MAENIKSSTISVVMPVYNGEQFLKEAIDSILNQTYSDFELLLINDGSTDDSENIIFSYIDPRIVYIKNQQNIGLIKTLNKGLDLATGEFIARMDQDDIADSSRFEIQLEVFRNNSDIGVCGSWLTRFGSNCENRLIKVPQNNEIIKIGLLGNNQFAHPTIMLRKSLIGEMRYDVNSKSAEDYEFWTRLSRITELYNIQEPLLQYRVHDANISVVDSVQQSLTAKNTIGKQLEYLGIENNVFNINCCKLLFSGDFPNLGHEELVELVNFANKLEQTNRIKLFYNQQILKETIRTKFYLIFDGVVKYNYAIIPFLLKNRKDILVGRNTFRNLKLFAKMLLK